MLDKFPGHFQDFSMIGAGTGALSAGFDRSMVDGASK
jgi:hypothetical protein